MGRRAVLFLCSTARFSVPPRCKDGRGTIRKMRLCFHVRKLVCFFCALAVLKETALFLLVTAMLGLGSGGFSLHTVWKMHLNVFLCRVSPVPGDPTGPVLHLLGPPEAHRLPRRSRGRWLRCLPRPSRRAPAPAAGSGRRRRERAAAEGAPSPPPSRPQRRRHARPLCPAHSMVAAGRSMARAGGLSARRAGRKRSGAGGGARWGAGRGGHGRPQVLPLGVGAVPVPQPGAEGAPGEAAAAGRRGRAAPGGAGPPAGPQRRPALRRGSGAGAGAGRRWGPPGRELRARPPVPPCSPGGWRSAPGPRGAGSRRGGRSAAPRAPCWGKARLPSHTAPRPKAGAAGRNWA